MIIEGGTVKGERKIRQPSLDLPKKREKVLVAKQLSNTYILVT